MSFTGYGHVTPLSQEGKLFCMLYALIGIPLTLVLLTALVDRLMIPTTKYLHFLNSHLGHLYPPFTIRLLHFGTILGTLIFLFLLLPAAMFTYLEPEWNYMDSLYYCFISLTTIGLGDYIPGDSPDQKYRPLYKLIITGKTSWPVGLNDQSPAETLSLGTNLEGVIIVSRIEIRRKQRCFC